jgi:2-dehydropantoate 2-reductase
MHVAIMGSGGVGAYVGARLLAAGERVSFIARGAHLHALQHGGLHIEAPLHPTHLPVVRATDDPASVGPVDLVVFAVKLWDSDAAARAMLPMVGPHTRVLTLQNGIDSIDMLARHVDRRQLVAGVIYLSAVISRPGVITSPGGFHRVVLDRCAGDAAVAAFCAAVERAVALDVTASDSIANVVWEKFIALASLSGATALLRARMGEILQHPETRALQLQLIEEAVAVGRAAGVPLRDGLAGEVMGKLAAMPPSFRASMAEDLERGKPLELQWLSGRVHQLGQQLGVPTPGHSVVYRALVLQAAGQAVAPA